MAIFEMIYLREDVPVNVAIDEAIEVAKIFGDDQSSKFINSVLSKVKQSVENSSLKTK